jgi:hypothetical protein
VFFHEEVFLMNRYIAVGASLAIMLLAGGVIVAADELKSGTPVGKSIPGPFNPLHCNGPDDGKKVCLV